jgi:DNA-binding beta-propeller fold protein YncE
LHSRPIVDRLAATVLIAAALAAACPARAAVDAEFLYPLSDGTAQPSFGWAAMAWDARAAELYVVDNAHGTVDVFNEHGMAVHSFGDPSGASVVAGIALLDAGTPLLLRVTAGAWSLIRCNFRGDPAERVEPRGVPATFLASFSPSAVQVAAGRIYLADKSGLKILVLEADGAYAASHDLAQTLGLDERKRADAMLRGFSVDGDGNILFTIATLFRAFIVAPDGRLRAFGDKGSVPGRFNVVGGIAADDGGHLFVTDTLRGVVVVFDRASLRFLGEFGRRGRAGAALVNPLELVVGNGRVFVTQSTGPIKTYAVQFE